MKPSLSRERWTTRFLGELRSASTGELVVWSSWLGLLISLEILGRTFAEAWFDFGAGLAVLGWVAATLVVNQSRPLQLIAWAKRQVPGAKWWKERLLFDWGVDLRRNPPLRRGFPAGWLWAAVAFAVLTLVILSLVVTAPLDARALITPWSYLAYLLPQAIVMGISIFLMTVLIFFVWAEIHDQSILDFGGQGVRPVTNEVRLLTVIVVVLLGACLYVPTWVPLVGLLGVLGIVTTALYLTSNDLVMVWRQETIARSGSFDGRMFVWFQVAAAILLLVNLTLLLGGGSELPGTGDAGFHLAFSSEMLQNPARLLARMLAWFSLGGACAMGFDALQLAAQGISFHPKRIARMEGRPLLLDTPFEIRRKLEIHCRRLIARGLQRLFKRAARRRLPNNSGLVLGLQHWFIMGLRSDAKEDYFDDRDVTVFSGTIGMPFYRVFPRQVRFHYWQIATALHIDLIYVERSVSFKRFLRVLRQMFEIYDMHGGTVRAEDRHFLGLAGVKVIIHDVDAGAIQSRDWDNKERIQYKEPDFKELDRARVLHIYQDRQETEVDTPVPGESNWVPDLSYLS